jgi:hypothetical protein
MILPNRFKQRPNKKEGHMEKDIEREKLISKMFDAALSEKFCQLYRKYDPKMVFEAWWGIAKDEAVKKYFVRWAWTRNITLDQALDQMDDYLGFIESSLHGTELRA